MNSIILNEKKLEIEDLKLAAELSLAKTKLDKYIVLLKKEYDEISICRNNNKI